MNYAEKVKELLNSGKSMGLMMVARNASCSELEAASVLDETDRLILDGSEFDRVYEFLKGFRSLTFFVEKGGNIFENTIKLGNGKDGMGYFNLFDSGCLNGHLLKSSVHKIALLKIPFMHLTSYQTVFFDKDGNSLYSFYLSRENHRHDEAEVLRFTGFMRGE
ncbi:MAG: ChuX/HutX family heme-like substrate-binding protein [Succinivibrio sp.]